MIIAYQYFISPIMSPSCRFTPSCSNYARIALKEHGLPKGLYLVISRILRCHPWHDGGHDPVPKSKHEFHKRCHSREGGNIELYGANDAGIVLDPRLHGDDSRKK